MNFPVGTFNGQTTTVNGVTYVYDSTKTAWKRSVSPIGNLTVLGNITTSNLTATSNVLANKVFTTSGLFWAGNGIAFSSFPTELDANVGTMYLGNIATQANIGFLHLGNIATQANLGTIVLNNATTQANIGTLFLGNASTQANLGAFQTFSNANAATQATGINNINANLGAYQLYANANIGTLFLSNASTQANLGAFQTFSNANAATQATSINTFNANLGAFQTFSNANAATQQTQINSIVTNANANIAAYLPTYTGNIGAGNIVTSGTLGNISGVNYIFATNYVYPNGVSILTGIGGTYSNTNVEAYFGANIGTLFLGNASTQANLGAFQTYANTTFTSYSNTNAAAYLTLGATIGSGSTTANLVAAATTTSTSTTTGALVVRGGAGVAGNVYADKFYTANGIFWSGNGAAYAAGGGGGGSSFTYTASATAPGSPVVGDQWFDTTDGTLYEYIDDGDSDQWVDIQTPTFASNAITTLLSGDVSTGGNISASSIVITSGIYWANGVPFVSSVYSNVNVEAYIGANLGTLFLGNTSTQANLGTLFLGNTSTQANLGTLFLGNTSTQANIGTLFLGNASTNANLGAFQTFSNANAATQATAINTINANLGAYQTYANTTIYSNANIVANLQNFVTSISTTANIRTTANVIAPNYLFANGVNILSTITAGSTYSNTNVATYLTLGANIGSGTTTTNLVATATTTSISTTTGALVVQGGAGIVGNLYVGNEFVVPGGGKITSTGLAYLLEKVTVSASAPSGNVNVDMATQSVLYWTGNATANVSANIRGTATQPLNSLLAIGQSVTAVLFLPNGASNFLVSNVRIDNTTVPVAYQGNAAPVLGNSNSIDIYSFTILKTASATYKIFASQTQFMHPG